MAETLIFPTRDYGRENIKQITASIRKGNSAIIIGLPGVGKSTIARLLANPKYKVWQDYLSDTGKIYHFVHIDYSFNPDAQEVMNQVRWELIRQGCSIPSGSDSFETLDAWFIAEDCSNRHVVLVFDGYDEVDGVQARALLNRLRRLRNRQMNMSFLFVGRHEPETLYEIDDLVDAVYHISPLNEPDQQLTIRRHEHRLGCTFSDQQKAWVLASCGGLPGFMKYMCDLLYDGKIIHNDQVLSTCLADRRINQICQDIWSDLTEKEQARLIEVATGQNPKDDELTKQLKQKHLLNYKGQVLAEILKKFILTLPEAQPRRCFWQIRPPYLVITARAQEHHLKLTPKESELVTLFLQKWSEPVSLDKLQQALWPSDPENPDQVIDDKRITKLVSRVRLKADTVLHNHNLLAREENSIENVRGKGYRLNPQIQIKTS